MGVTLPVAVEQLDLPEQNHTNALVLEYLLQAENSVTFSSTSANTSKSDAHQLLDMVMDLKPPTQVILDVGAQVLELSNLEVAQTWLRRTSDNTQKQAVIFIDDHDTICVLDRAGIIEPLQFSPFAQQLGACYVFLDEAHTRGIDLKLPPTYRAAVTLGAGITKDKLVQACMRMRKLGKGQSVVFIIPEEIKTKISSLSAKSSDYIEVSDVLCWATPWAVQGDRFERQRELWRSYSGQEKLTQSEASHFLEDESQTLEQRYRPGVNSTPKLGTDSPKTENMQRIRERCRQFGDVSFSSTRLQEEQERQLAPEKEQERQIQRPPSARPKDHEVHPDLRLFVSSGVLAKPSKAFRPPFEVLKYTSAAQDPVISQFPGELLVTSDFAETVWVPIERSYLDDYQRPVEWVLTSRDHSLSNIKHMIIISPHEANELLPEVRKSPLVTMHLYAPRQNLNRGSLDDLGLYPISRNPAIFKIPTTLKIQLNLFAGQLYMSAYDEYHQLCDFLGGLSIKTPSGYKVAADGFILAKNEPSVTTFTRSPLKLLKTLMSQIRKDGQEIGKTHLGKILDGKLLCPSDFEDRFEYHV